MEVPFFKHNISKKDIMNLENVLRSTIITTGPVVEEFEKIFSNDFSISHACAVSSCTAALHLTLLAAGIKEGDEVITTPLSFVATAHAIRYTGATPRFVDVDPATGNIDIDLIEKNITKKTKAIVPVHLYGHMVDMKRLNAVARKYQVHIIEDAAHALESSRDTIRPGDLSFAACFSFYATKSITGGEGGMVITKQKRVYDVIRRMRAHGITKSMAQRYGKLYQHYDVKELGWKYNMTDIQAALLIGQFKRSNAVWLQRKNFSERYRIAFAGNGISMPKIEAGVKHAHHLFTFWVSPKKRNSILQALQKKNIGIGVHYNTIHLMSYYRNTYGFQKGDFPHAEDIANKTISLPLYSSMTEKEISYVIKNVISICKTI